MTKKFDLNEFFEQLKLSLNENYEADGLDSEVFSVEESSVDVFLEEIAIIAKNVISGDSEEIDSVEEEFVLDNDLFLLADDEELD